MRRCALAGLALAAGGAACARASAHGGDRVVAIAHVTVWDGRDSIAQHDQTVVVRGDRIVAVAPSSATRIPAGAHVVDGRGRFLIPGLWDMHVHADVAAGRSVLALYVANGVTGVRDMAGRWETLSAWRREIAAGSLVGPQIVASGPYLEGDDIPVPHLLARTPAEGVAAVDSLARMGVDFVKVHGRLSGETFLAVTRRSRELGLPVAGHVPPGLGAVTASDAGVRSIEHLLGVPLPCTAADSVALQPRFPVQGALGRCSSSSPAVMHATLARNETWVTPTLTAMYEIAVWPVAAVPGDTLARFLPDTLRAMVASLFQLPAAVPLRADSVGRELFARRQTQVAAMHRAGVGLLTGTDAPLRNSPPGFGLHEELQLLVEGGLSPFEVLRAATLGAARFLGATDSLGAIAPGQVADLVLLDGDPLLDIRNTRRIRGVVRRGKYYDRRALDRLLRAAAGGAP